MQLVTFEDFVKLSNFFYRTIGIEPYRREGSSNSKTWLISLIFYTNFINMNLIFIGEILFAVLAFVQGKNVLEAILTLSYIGFVLVGNIKLIFIYTRKESLSKFVSGLQQIFPKTKQQQRQYNTLYYLNLCSRITMSFSILYMILIWTYNLFSIIQYLIFELLLNVSKEGQTLPYFMFVPWDWHNHWSYYLLYVSQDIAGYTATAGQISGDLLLTACVTQLVMHYDFISERLSSYEVKRVSKEDIQFLRYIVEYHNKILDLTDELNMIFGFPLLLNFSVSSFVICFVGFQATLGAPIVVIIKLLLFLVSSVVQVSLMCHYGQQLIDASTQVAEAAYNQNWYQADVRYMKILILITRRAQKPAFLKATFFVLVSRETLTQIMQLSYKFFALLRTMYAE